MFSFFKTQILQMTRTQCAYPHVTLAVDDEQHDGAEPDEVLPPLSKLFSVMEKMDYSYS